MRSRRHLVPRAPPFCGGAGFPEYQKMIKATLYRMAPFSEMCATLFRFCRKKLRRRGHRCASDKALIKVFIKN